MNINPALINAANIGSKKRRSAGTSPNQPGYPAYFMGRPRSLLLNVFTPNATVLTFSKAEVQVAGPVAA